MCTDNPLGLMRLGVSSVMGMIMYCAVHPGWRVRVSELDTLQTLNETAMVHARREHGAGPGLLAPESAPWATLARAVFDDATGVYRERESGPRVAADGCDAAARCVGDRACPFLLGSEACEAERESREGRGRG